ncbi:MAG: tRNA (guanosine(46)-N7)-methyltransferase TrmB, partial [Paramuribaculum sp.]|nr:tRNA (guanosine(46)-N7)-methyltransferase TrmB [Paramuribaculum sp.]
MGKNKLKKFREMEEIDFVFQYPWARLQQSGFPLKGRWHEDFFHNDRPIILELGCGKGEYTVGLAGANPDANYIGIDIKGARMWTGASQAKKRNMTNVAFLRTDIELLPEVFGPGEVAEIWITFPDPQMKKTRKRLTS